VLFVVVVASHDLYLNIFLNRICQREKFDRCYSVDLLSNIHQTDEINSSKSTDSALYSMSDKSSRILKNIFYYFISSKSKVSINKNLSSPCRKFFFVCFLELNLFEIV
jgi:hypothetical protein